MGISSYIFIILQLIPTLVFADGGMCVRLLGSNPTMSRMDYEQSLSTELRAEWEYAKQILEAKEINYDIHKTEYEPVIVFSINGTHSLNRLAKDLEQKYGVRLIYEVGIDHAGFRKDFTADGNVNQLYISIPAQFLDLPFAVTRTYGVLHELRHLINYLNAFKGIELPYYGNFSTNSDAPLPHKKSNMANPSFLETVSSFFGKSEKQKQQARVEDIYKEISVDEIRTYFSTVYQQALKISLRLKQRDMTAVELKERVDQLITDIGTLQLLSEKIHFNLTEVKLALESGTQVVVTTTKFNDQPIYVGNLKYQIEGVEVFYQTQLPLLKSETRLKDTYQAVERQINWSLLTATKVLEILKPLSITNKEFTAVEARSYVDQVLEAINPSVRRSLEQIPQ